MEASRGRLSREELIEQTRRLIEEAQALTAMARRILDQAPCWDPDSALPGEEPREG
jgi:hypothetical protein